MSSSAAEYKLNTSEFPEIKKRLSELENDRKVDENRSVPGPAVSATDHNAQNFRRCKARQWIVDLTKNPYRLISGGVSGSLARCWPMRAQRVLEVTKVQ